MTVTSKLAGHVADDLILEVVNVAVAAQGQVSAVALGIAAVKLHAVDGTNVVDVDSVPSQRRGQ